MVGLTFSNGADEHRLAWTCAGARDPKMAAILFPQQRRRWGSESTNFFGSSQSVDPGYGVPVPERVHRCQGSQYTNCGHLHVGAKIFNRCGRGGARAGWAVSVVIIAVRLQHAVPLFPFASFTRQDSHGTLSAYHLRADDQRLAAVWAWSLCSLFPFHAA